MYQMHVKQALELLKKTSMKGDEKNSRIRQLSELLNEVKRTNRVSSDTNLIKPNEENTQTPEIKEKQEVQEVQEVQEGQKEKW